MRLFKFNLFVKKVFKLNKIDVFILEDNKFYIVFYVNIDFLKMILIR